MDGLYTLSNLWSKMSTHQTTVYVKYKELCTFFNDLNIKYTDLILLVISE